MVQPTCLVKSSFNELDEKSVKGRKEEKVKEIKGKGHSAIWTEKKKGEVPECED